MVGWRIETRQFGTAGECGASRVMPQPEINNNLHIHPLYSTMPPLTLEEKAQIAHDLRSTNRELKDRGLLVAAKW
jgi:hypothetical protein